MKLKKIISALTASAVLASALPVYSGLLTFADDTDETVSLIQLIYHLMKLYQICLNGLMTTGINLLFQHQVK